MAAGLALIAAGLWQISAATVGYHLRGHGPGHGSARRGRGPGHPDCHRLGHRLGAGKRQRRGLGHQHHRASARRRAGRGRGRQPAGHPLPGQPGPGHLPHAVAATVNSSLGGALAVAARAGERPASSSPGWPAARSSAVWTSACSPRPWSPWPEPWRPWPGCPAARAGGRLFSPNGPWSQPRARGQRPGLTPCPGGPAPGHRPGNRAART